MTLLLSDTAPTYMHAELHDAYGPKARDPRADEAQRIIRDINAKKMSDPSAHIYDSLVDQLVSNSLQMARQYETDEPFNWTAPQRVVWRSDALPKERLFGIVNDRNLSKDIKAHAEVNGGRWLVRCPLTTEQRTVCMGAQYASFLDRRTWCVSCHNQMVSGRWIQVIWPHDIAGIERALLERPENARHWTPNETVSDLLEQNENEHV